MYGAAQYVMEQVNDRLKIVFASEKVVYNDIRMYPNYSVITVS